MKSEDIELLERVKDVFENIDSDTLYVLYSVIDEILVDRQYFDEEDK